MTLLPHAPDTAQRTVVSAPQPREDSPALPAGVPRVPSLRQLLLDAPSRFTFDAAVAAMMRASRRAEPGTAVRFEAVLGLPFAWSDVAVVRDRPEGAFAARTALLGLTGPGGTLPRPYTDMAVAESRGRSDALSAFLDLLAQRPLAQLAQAGIKYRPHRSADAAAIAGAQATEAPRDGLRQALMALTGYAEPGLASRLRSGLDPILFYSGLFAARPRSAGRLAAMLSEWLGQPVAVEQFSGHWLALGPEQMSRLPKNGNGQFNRLGVDAAAGARAWDIQSGVTLRIGPLSFEQFEALLPGRPLLRALMALASSYLGAEVRVTVNSILAAADVPAPMLSGARACRLGWTGWLPIPSGRTHDAADAKFTRAFDP